MNKLTTYWGKALGKQSLLDAVKAGGWKVRRAMGQGARAAAAGRICLHPCCACRCSRTRTRVGRLERGCGPP